jgi:hypothetical protein
MQKNKYIFENISTILSNKFLQIFSIISVLIFGYFTSTLDTKSGYFESLTMALTYQQFITLCFLPMIIVSNILIIDLFEKNNMLIIRFQNKNKYINALLKNVVYCNTFVFLIIMIVIITFFNFFSNGDFTIKYINFFKTTNLVYVIYTIIKLYILTINISIIFTLLLKILNKISALIISIVISSSLFICQWVNYSIVDKIYKMPLYIGFYFLNTIEYSNFFLNLISFVLYMLFLAIIIFILYKLTIRFLKVVGEQ